ncbi:hypothetical protein [Schleiferilactobacillus harbinensis]|uniref:hypothetical protein n=1 Tax=Schleiferilactobacillus harbinensis TaxID=304207 RepID=UPI0021A39140|nr:hypothetical protein [Schleiferilactobacillus harbinensis]
MKLWHKTTVGLAAGALFLAGLTGCSNQSSANAKSGSSVKQTSVTLWAGGSQI